MSRNSKRNKEKRKLALLANQNNVAKPSSAKLPEKTKLIPCTKFVKKSDQVISEDFVEVSLDELDVTTTHSPVLIEKPTITSKQIPLYPNYDGEVDWDNCCY